MRGPAALTVDGVALEVCDCFQMAARALSSGAMGDASERTRWQSVILTKLAALSRYDRITRYRRAPERAALVPNKVETETSAPAFLLSVVGV